MRGRTHGLIARKAAQVLLCRDGSNSCESGVWKSPRMHRHDIFPFRRSWGAEEETEHSRRTRAARETRRVKDARGGVLAGTW